MAVDRSDKELRSADHLKHLSAERSRQNRIRTVLGSGIFALFLIFAMTIAQQFRSFDSARLEVKMNARASASLWPIVSEELDALIPKVLPPLDATFRAESPRYLPRLVQHLEVEVERYSEDAEEQGDRILDAALEQALEARSEEIAALQGSLDGEETRSDGSFDAMVERAQGWARAELDHVFGDEDSVLDRLREKALQSANGEPSAENLDDLLMSLIAVVNPKTEQGG